jgi:molecular chaperone GrpE (heat shock protein)
MSAEDEKDESRAPSAEEGDVGVCELKQEDAESLKEKLEGARLEAAQYRDEAARAKADFYNYRTRVERDRARDRTLAAENAVTELLPVLDNLERALGAEPDKESAMYKGVSMVQKQFWGVLQNMGLKVIEASGPFDPSIHEAVMTIDVESDEEDGVIAGVLGVGYMLGDKVLRAVRVKVGRKKPKKLDEK